MSVPTEDIISSSFSNLNIGWWAGLAVFGFLAFLFLIAIAIGIFIAIKKNWIILKWKYNVLFFKPSGKYSFEVFLDQATPIEENKQIKWKFRRGNFTIAPPERQYITANNWVFFWSSTFREAVPFMPSIAGFLGKGNPAREAEVMATLSFLKRKGEMDIENIRKTRKSEKEAGLTLEGEEITEADYIDRLNAKMQEIQESYVQECQKFTLALEPKVDTAILNSLMAEGEKAIRAHRMPDNWTTYFGLAIILVIVVVSLMLSAAEAMARADAEKKQAESDSQLSSALNRLADVLNETKTQRGLTYPTPMQIPSGR